MSLICHRDKIQKIENLQILEGVKSKQCPGKICRCSKSAFLHGVEWDRLIVHRTPTMTCPPVRGNNPRALASGLSYVQVDKHGITILYHLHQCGHCTS